VGAPPFVFKGAVLVFARFCAALRFDDVYAVENKKAYLISQVIRFAGPLPTTPEPSSLQWRATTEEHAPLRNRHSERRGGSFLLSSACSRTSRLAVEESLFACGYSRDHHWKSDSQGWLSPSSSVPSVSSVLLFSRLSSPPSSVPPRRPPRLCVNLFRLFPRTRRRPRAPPRTLPVHSARSSRIAPN
jgi:hypothetical protein